MEDDDEEGGFRVQRRSSRVRLNNVVLEDGERLAMRIMESRRRERRQQELDEDFLNFPGKRYFKSHPLPSEKDWEIILERKKRFLLSLGENNEPAPRPLYNNDVGLVDDSNACSIVVDVNAVKQLLSIDRCNYYYNALLTFAVECRYRCCLEMFDHPGQPGNLVRVQNIDIERERVALFTIWHYNKICRIHFPYITAKLELQDILWINCYESDSHFHAYYYVTLRAKDNETGQIGLYQAAVLQQYDRPAADEYLLGLLRDRSDGRILAIISLTGADKDFEKRSKDLFTI